MNNKSLYCLLKMVHLFVSLTHYSLEHLYPHIFFLYLKKNLIKISGSGIRKHFTFVEGLPPAGGGDPSSLLPVLQWLATTAQRARSPFAALDTNKNCKNYK